MFACQAYFISTKFANIQRALRPINTSSQAAGGHFSLWGGDNRAHSFHSKAQSTSVSADWDDTRLLIMSSLRFRSFYMNYCVRNVIWSSVNYDGLYNVYQSVTIRPKPTSVSWFDLPASIFTLTYVSLRFHLTYFSFCTTLFVRKA